MYRVTLMKRNYKISIIITEGRVCVHIEINLGSMPIGELYSIEFGKAIIRMHATSNMGNIALAPKYYPLYLRCYWLNSRFTWAMNQILALGTCLVHRV